MIVGGYCSFCLPVLTDIKPWMWPIARRAEARGYQGNLPVLCWPCLVIRRVCDNIDSHKNKGWQDYAATSPRRLRSAREVLLSMVEKVVEELNSSATDKLEATEKVQSTTVVCPAPASVGANYG
jgi:hypothetical protein